MRITDRLPIVVLCLSLSPTGHAGGKAFVPVTLAEVMRQGLSGLALEEARNPDWREVRAQAREFVRFRTGRMNAKQKLLWIADCFNHPGVNVFCDFIVERRARFREPLPVVSIGAGAAVGADPAAMVGFTPIETGSDESLRSSADLFRISEQLSGRDPLVFQGARETDIHRALRLYPNWEPLQPLAEAAAASRACPSTALLTALGQKTEEHFPAPRFRELAIQLYGRAAECAQPGEIGAQKARYRAALLHIWEGRCRMAEPLLVTLSEQENGDFVSRSLFWRVQCAKTVGNKLLTAVLRGRLLKDFPLSYHGLLLSLGSGGGAPAQRLLDLRDPPAVFRSESRQSVNPILRGAEALQDLGSHSLALELLDAVEGELEALEVPVRLYLAVLTGRSGDTIGQFRTLATIFQDAPSAISRSTLQLFYPLKRFELLRRHEAKVDPLLVAALIRQESGFNERARSPAGAMGLMQLMPETARRMERVSTRELFDAKTNIRLGVKYFYGLLDRYGGDAELALAGYNAGPERVDEWRRRYTTSNRMLFFDLIPFKETRDYVALIARNYYWYLNLYGLGDATPPGQSLDRRLAGTARAKGRPPVLFTVFGSM